MPLHENKVLIQQMVTSYQMTIEFSKWSIILEEYNNFAPKFLHNEFPYISIIDKNTTIVLSL